MTDTKISRSGSFNHPALTLSKLSAVFTLLGTSGIFATLSIIYFWFGGMKFTAYEAQGLVPLIENSPLLSWVYEVFSVRVFSNILGVIEVCIGLLIALRFFSPKLSAIGGILSSGLFVTTLTFMVSTPGVFEPSLGFPAISVMPGQFLLKDLGLLAASLFVTGRSLSDIVAE
ncbi:YkgB family protein [Kiloniella sp.]|uniref:YkgB family protein n=1 Tax=Kiloniella sp. TaxID=1938587 RepID=UPI003B02AF2F